MLTGSYGTVNGIIANDWYDARTGREVYCAADTTVALIGGEGEGRSPRNLHGATVGDLLKIATGGKSKVVTMSLKDRSAIMLGGHLGDGAYWMQDTLFVSSTYYRPELPPWVREFNAAGNITQYFGKKWEHLLPAAAYETVGPDDVPTESDEAGLGRTFPHLVAGGDSLGEGFVDAFDISPFGNDVLADLAMKAVTAEGLGRDAVTDLLGVSFSANDRVGHAYGPDSHEVMDVTVRLDRTLARLFGFLDRTVGLANTIIVLTADHGVAPLPEVFARLHPGASARRFNPAVMDTVVNRALEARYGQASAPGWVAYHDQPQLYLNLAALRNRRVPVEEAERVAAAAILAVPGVHEALTATELARARGAGARTGEVFSFQPGAQRKHLLPDGAVHPGGRRAQRHRARHAVGVRPAGAVALVREPDRAGHPADAGSRGGYRADAVGVARADGAGWGAGKGAGGDAAVGEDVTLSAAKGTIGGHGPLRVAQGDTKRLPRSSRSPVPPRCTSSPGRSALPSAAARTPAS